MAVPEQGSLRASRPHLPGRRPILHSLEVRLVASGAGIEGEHVVTPLPSRLDDLFTVASATEVAVTRKRLRGRDLESPTTGVRRVRREPLDLRGHAAGFAVALPRDAAFSHVTAARLHGLPAPTPWPGPSEPLDVMRDRPRNPVTRTGCRGHRGLETRAVVVRDGLRLTAPLDTWCDLAGVWEPADLLAAADVLVRRSLASVDDLLGAARSRRGRRGVGDLLAVAPLARGGSASPAESRARHRFLEWGLPEPELNVAVLDAHGQWLATADFLWRQQRVVGEYDGDVHRTDRRTWQRDRERRAAIEDASYAYVEMTAMSFDEERRAEALRARLVRLLLPP